MGGKVKTEKFDAKSVLISRKPRDNDSDEFKTAVIALYTENNPHKSGIEPTQILEYPNMEKIRIRDLNVSYYLEGNDTVINDLKFVSLEIDEDTRKIVLRADQEKVEGR